MLQHEGSESIPCVEIGQRVCAGQLIGRPGSGNASVPVHAPTSGRVTDVVRVETPYAAEVLAVQIEPDGRNEWIPPSRPAAETLDAEALVDEITSAGVIGTGAEGVPIGDILREVYRRKVRHLIINAMESEPYLTAEYRILCERGGSVVRTANLLARKLGIQRLWLALDRENTSLIRDLRHRAHGTPLRITPLPNKYPQGATPLLVRSIVGHEIPYGKTAMDVGVVVLDTATVLAIGQAVFDGHPFVSRILTVAGHAAAKPGNYEVSFGTPLHRIVEQVGVRGDLHRVVIGGPMTGLAVSSLDGVTTKRVSAVLLLSARQAAVRRPRACIRCGWCLEDCPVGLDPPSLLMAAEAGRADDIARLFPHACLACGICTYVCPSELPLAEGVAKARARVAAVSV